MTVLEKTINWVAAPEIFSIICLLIPPARKWLLKLIENSDGDPHHTDGLFIATLWLGMVLIRTAVIIGLHDVISDTHHTDLVLAFLGFGSTLLGARIINKKISLDSFTKKSNENDSK